MTLAASTAQLRTVETKTHGRYLLQKCRDEGPVPLVIGFHGYGENAGTHLDALRGIEGIQTWLVVAVQALHRFYTRDQRIVASWMTREDREAAIEDNLEYIWRVLTAIRAEAETRPPLVFAGFSQGGAMAYRAAARFDADAVIVLAADVPPDVDVPGVRLPHVLLGRGTRDEWYTAAKHAADLEVLARRAALVESCIFDGGHEWTPPFHAAAARLLAALQSGQSRALRSITPQSP